MHTASAGWSSSTCCQLS